MKQNALPVYLVFAVFLCGFFAWRPIPEVHAGETPVVLSPEIKDEHKSEEETVEEDQSEKPGEEAASGEEDKEGAEKKTEERKIYEDRSSSRVTFKDEEKRSASSRMPWDEKARSVSSGITSKDRGRRASDALGLREEKLKKPMSGRIQDNRRSWSKLKSQEKTSPEKKSRMASSRLGD